jgi:transposase
MPHSRTLYIGGDGHKASLAVAYVAKEPEADVIDRGTIGTRPVDLDSLVRTLPSKAKPLVFVDAAGPCGDWLSHALPQQGHGCRSVAPSWIPTTAGDRGKTDCRDAVPLARLRRAGDVPPGDVPQVEDEALHDRTRARRHHP